MIISYWAVGEEHRKMAEVSARTARLCHPFARVVIDTYIAEKRPMMVANLDSQIKVLQEAKENEEVLFLDTDILMRKPFPFESHDMTVTWRDTTIPGVVGVAKMMPYNYGVLGCRARPATIEAFYWLRSRILQMSNNYQQWYGNQLALAELAAAPERDIGHAVRYIRWSATDPGTPLIVKYLPCEVYNYTPQSENEDVSEKTFLHFKGGRKHMMASYNQ